MTNALLLLILFEFTSAQTGWSGSNAELCVFPLTSQIRPTSTCSDTNTASSNCRTQTAIVTAQRGEIEDVQLLLRKGIDVDDIVGGLSNVTISVHNLPPFVTATTFRVGYVKAHHSPRYAGSGGGWRPDPLLPIKLPFSIPSSTAQPLYVTLAVDRNAVPGQYNNATVQITCTTSNGKPCSPDPLTVALSITVLNVTLPSLKDSRIGSAWSGSWNDETFQPYYPDRNVSATKHEWFDLMLSSRMPPDSIYLTKPREYSDYQYMHAKGVKWFALLDVSALPLAPPGGAGEEHLQPIDTFGHVGHGGGVTGSCANYTDEYVSRMIATLRPMVDRMDKDGMLSSAYIYGFDENPVSCEPQVRKLFGATKKAFPTLRTAAVLNWSPMPVDLPVDIWILQYEEFNATDVAAWVHAGKEQWQYHCIEPNDISSLNTFIERPTFQARLMMWLSALNHLQYGAPTGWLYYAVNLWRPCDNPLCAHNYTTRVPLVQNNSSPFVDFPVGNYIWQEKYNDIFANGDGQYLYPCEDGLPCGSVRLSALRDGLEDWELFSVVAPAVGVPLLKEMVRGARDWEFVGDRRMGEIRATIAKSVAGAGEGGVDA